VERLCQQHDGEIDLLLTDVVMREVSGPDLARRVQKVRPEIKVVFMSGYTDSAIVHQGTLDPGIAFLPKPFTPSTLAGRVRQALDEGRGLAVGR
jgi:DNA-binding NtrC family response regulator